VLVCVLLFVFFGSRSRILVTPGSALNQFERWTVEERHSSGHATATPEPLRVDIADRPIFITELQ
jgi:hypothetical protein